MTKTELLDRIGAFTELEDNWDSYGALSPTGPAIVAATDFVERFVHATDSGKITPIPINDGGVALMCIDTEGDEYSIEFTPDGKWDLAEYVTRETP